MSAQERDTKSIAGKFAEALGAIETSLHWLGQVNEQYDPEKHDDNVPARFCNSALDFWLQANLAEDALRTILGRLQRVAPLAPKEVTESDVLGALVTAIGRHPAAEEDPEITDAIADIEDALQQKEETLR